VFPKKNRLSKRMTPSHETDSPAKINIHSEQLNRGSDMQGTDDVACVEDPACFRTLLVKVHSVI
jgi:hypothetical protein